MVQESDYEVLNLISFQNLLIRVPVSDDKVQESDIKFAESYDQMIRF